MRYRLKDIDFSTIKYNLGISNDYGKLLNLNESLEFQTPKIFIDTILSENGKGYLILKIHSNEACKTFCSKIFEFEKTLPGVISIFDGSYFKVKIPFTNGNPQIKVFCGDNFFNYYNLKKGMEVICLVSISKIWKSVDTTTNYYLNVKEILVTKQI